MPLLTGEEGRAGARRRLRVSSRRGGARGGVCGIEARAAGRTRHSPHVVFAIPVRVVVCDGVVHRVALRKPADEVGHLRLRFLPSRAAPAFGGADAWNRSSFQLCTRTEPSALPLFFAPASLLLAFIPSSPPRPVPRQRALGSCGRAPAGPREEAQGRPPAVVLTARIGAACGCVVCSASSSTLMCISHSMNRRSTRPPAVPIGRLRVVVHPSRDGRAGGAEYQIALTFSEDQSRSVPPATGSSAPGPRSALPGPSRTADPSTTRAGDIDPSAHFRRLPRPWSLRHRLERRPV